MKETVGLILMLILLSSFVYSECTYVPSFEVTDDSVTTLYPNAGDKVVLRFTVNSKEIYVGNVSIYIENGGFTYPLKEEEVYITEGENKFKYEVQLPTYIPSGTYFLHIVFEGFDHIIPLTVKGVDYTQEVYNDNNKKIHIVIGINKSVDVSYYAKSYSGGVENKHYRVQPVDGRVEIVDDVCENCKLTLLLGYEGTVAKVERVYGMYSEPYVRIVEFGKDHITFESCAQGKYETYVDGIHTGVKNGIGRIDKELENGYENVKIRFVSEKGSTLLDKNVNLAAIRPRNVTVNLFIAKKSPFEIRITAKDEYGRDARSEGYLTIEDPKGINYTQWIEFEGEYSQQINLADGNYKVYYNGHYAEGSAVAQKYETPAPEVERETFVPKDLVPVLIPILIFALIVVVWIWLKRWNRNI